MYIKIIAISLNWENAPSKIESIKIDIMQGLEVISDANMNMYTKAKTVKDSSGE